MKTDKELKTIVKEKYSSIAEQKSSCCTTASFCGCGTEEVFNIQDSYAEQKGYVKEADLGLGCGLPTQYAGIKEGDTVVDLGSGAGNDVFVARQIVGDKGKVIGIDMTEKMIEMAELNNKKLGFSNVEFHLSEIENMPLATGIADVIISNCVLNLVPDKVKAFKEIHRILKPGAHFCISDIVLKGELPEALQKSAEAYTGCVAGGLQQLDYLNLITNAGFFDVEIKKSKPVELPEALLSTLGVADEVKKFREQGGGIFSITVTGTKN